MKSDAASMSSTSRSVAGPSHMHINPVKMGGTVSTQLSCGTPDPLESVLDHLDFLESDSYLYPELDLDEDESESISNENGLGTDYDDVDDKGRCDSVDRRSSDKDASSQCSSSGDHDDNNDSNDQSCAQPIPTLKRHKRGNSQDFSGTCLDGTPKQNLTSSVSNPDLAFSSTLKENEIFVSWEIADKNNFHLPLDGAENQEGSERSALLSPEGQWIRNCISATPSPTPPPFIPQTHPTPTPHPHNLIL